MQGNHPDVVSGVAERYEVGAVNAGDRGLTGPVSELLDVPLMEDRLARIRNSSAD